MKKVLLISLCGVFLCIVNSSCKDKSRQKNDVSEQISNYLKSTRIDTVHVNDSIFVVYNYKNGFIEKITSYMWHPNPISEKKGRVSESFQDIYFYSNGHMKEFSLIKILPLPNSIVDIPAGGLVGHAYQQELVLDSLGNAIRYYLAKDFKTVAVSK